MPTSTDDLSIDQLPVVEVALEDLAEAESVRTLGENQEHVELLVAAYGELPPILVHGPTMRTIDGYHRVKAARMCGARTIAARVFEGDEADALVLAVKLNVTHGLPLSLSDRKRAAERIMRCRPQWSNRRVAAVSGISPGTVAAIRKWSGGGIAAAGSRIGQDGRTRPVDASAGRRLAGELLSQDPSLSLRKVARIAALSPETVRDVRNRLRQQPAAENVVEIRRHAQERISQGPRPAPVSAPARVQGPTPDPAMVVRWLKADPALRFSESGRNLLRLFSLHHSLTKDWNGIVANVPAHCNDIVVDLARQFAGLWIDLASRAAEEEAAGPQRRAGTA